MDQIVEQLSKLQELSIEELASLEESVLAEADAIDVENLSADSVGTLNKLADAAEAVRTEQARRATEASALAEAAAEASARIRPAKADDSDTAADGTEAGAESWDEADKPEDEDEDEDDPSEASSVPMDKADDEEPDGTTPSEDPDAAKDDSVPEDEKPWPKGMKASGEPEPEPEPEPAPETPSAPEVASAAEETAAAETPSGSEASTTSTTDTPATPNTEKTPEAPVTASAEGGELLIEPPADRKPQVRPTTTLSITAGADVPGFSSGTPLKDDLEVADAFQRRLHSLRNAHGGDGEQHIVASYVQEFPGNRFLSATDPMENTDKIQSVTSREAITAAAGVCLPLETRYDMFCDIGVTDRPVRDSLARFGADRGGIRYFSAPTLASAEGATGYWRSEDGPTAGGTDTEFATYGPDRVTPTNPANAKPCLEVQCVEEKTAWIEAITLCLTFNNLTTRTFPELIKRHNELALVAHARIAENALLAQIEAGSTAVTMPAQVISATREILNVLALAVAAYRHKHRMDGVAPLRLILPAWVRDLIRADMGMQMPGDGFDMTMALADATIDAWLKSRGVNVTWHLDGTGPGEADINSVTAGVQLGFKFPETLEFALFAEGTWLYLDGGTLDLGVIRDSTLVATNQYKQFVETFEGLANVGCDSYWFSVSLKPTGQAASLVDTLA